MTKKKKENHVMIILADSAICDMSHDFGENDHHR